MRTLNRLKLAREVPKVLFCDNGSEFTSQAMDLWAYRNGAKIDFSRPGKPTDNAFVESFNGTFVSVQPYPLSTGGRCYEDGGMGERVRRSIAAKRRIVELTLGPGMSVSRVAQSEGVNAHQVFDWRRAYHDGRLVEPGTGGLIPVVIAGDASSDERGALSQPQELLACGSIHIEIPERAMISVEPGADRALLRTVLELLRK